MRATLGAAIKAAMRDGDKPKLSTLRMMSAKIKDADLAAQGSGKPSLTEGELIELLARMVKQRRESIEAFKSGNRPELAAQEEAEIAVILGFMPAAMSESEADAAIAAVLAETGAASIKDMGRVMALLKERFAGRMDFTKASGLVRARLAGGGGKT